MVGMAGYVRPPELKHIQNIIADIYDLKNIKIRFMHHPTFKNYYIYSEYC
jgi:hypothetical protein